MIRVIVAVLTAVVTILRWVDAAEPARQAFTLLTPVDAVTGIADALASHPVAGLSPGEGHGDARGPAFAGLPPSEPQRLKQLCGL